MFTVITGNKRRVLHCANVYRLLKHLVFHHLSCFVIGTEYMYEITSGVITTHKL